MENIDNDLTGDIIKKHKRKKLTNTVMGLIYFIVAPILIFTLGWLWGLILTIPVGMIAGIIIGTLLIKIFYP